MVGHYYAIPHKDSPHLMCRSSLKKKEIISYLQINGLQCVSGSRMDETKINSLGCASNLLRWHETICTFRKLECGGIPRFVSRLPEIPKFSEIKI